MPTTLDEWLQKPGRNQTKLARDAGVPIPQISIYLSGRRRPGLTNALKIERATKGAVTAESWARGLKRLKRKDSKQRLPNRVRSRAVDGAGGVLSRRPRGDGRQKHKPVDGGPPMTDRGLGRVARRGPGHSKTG